MAAQAILSVLYRTSAAARLPFIPRLPLRLSLVLLRLQARRQKEFRSLITRFAKQAGSMLNSNVEIIEDGPTIASLIYRTAPPGFMRHPLLLRGAIYVPIFGGDGVRAALKVKPRVVLRFDEQVRNYLRDLAWQIERRAEDLKQSEEEEQFNACVEELRRILPQDVPEAAGFSLSGRYRPDIPVRADYYDYFKLDTEKIALVLADVPGRGNPAVLLAKLLQSTARRCATADASPGEVCVRINQEVCRSLAPATVIRLFYAVLDISRRQISFSNAGHHPPYLVRRNGGCYQFDAGGPFLGLSPDAVYDEATFDLVAGDRLAIYSDGLVSAGEHRGNGEEFGSDRLIDILRKHPLSDANDLCGFLMGELDRHSGQRDDVALVTMTLR
jgi:hypothetical protein